MHDDDERHPELRWQRLEEALQRMDTPGRGADSNHGHPGKGSRRDVVAGVDHAEL